MQAEPLHRHSSQAEYTSGRLCSPAVLNSLPHQGLPMLHLVSALGYDWACTMLVDAGASIHLQVSMGCIPPHPMLTPKLKFRTGKNPVLVGWKLSPYATEMLG